LNDSIPIALHLDEILPAPEYPALFPNGQASYALAVAVNELMRNVVFAGYALLVARIADILDEPRGKEYFISTRGESLGKPLADVRPTDQDEVTRLINEMKNKMGVICQMLKGGKGEERRKKAGPFFEGDQPGLADFIFQAFLLWVKVSDEHLWAELVGVGDGEVRALWDAVCPWVEGQGEEVAWDIPE
jgi:glutathione S-transferase